MGRVAGGRCLAAGERRLWVEPSPSEPSAGGSGSGTSHLSGRLRQPVDADLALRWMGSASEKTMTTENSIPARQRSPWNRGRLIGQKRPLKPKDVWTIRVRLQMEGRRRDLAMFNLAIDSKLRGCDLVRLRIDDVFAGGRVRDRATVIQKKTGRPVQFEITEQTRAAIGEWLTALDARKDRICSQAVSGESHTCRRGNTPALSIDGRTARGSIARHTVRTLCAERSRRRSTRRPVIYEQCSCSLATRNWRAPCVISGSSLMMRSASRSRSNFNRAQISAVLRDLPGPQPLSLSVR